MFCFSLLSIFYFSLSTGNLSVEIQNIDSANGNIMLAVFEKEQDSYLGLDRLQRVWGLQYTCHRLLD